MIADRPDTIGPHEPSLAPALRGVGYFISPKGGAPGFFSVGEGQLLFEVITAGAVYGPVGNQEQLCGPGWVFAHRPHDHTIFRSEPDGHYECLTASFDYRENVDWSRSFFWEGSTLDSFSHEMIHAFHYTDMPRELLGQTIWAQLRFRMETYNRDHNLDDLDPRLQRAVDYIQRYYAQDIHIDEIASQVDWSASHLHAMFREAMGVSPHQYVIRQRMRAARQALVMTQDPIKGIAAQVGYANPENFTRIFKQHFKLTPAKYRRTYTIDHVKVDT